MFSRALESTRQRERNIERARTLSNRGVSYLRDVEWYDRLHPGFTYDYLWKRIQDHGIDVECSVVWLTSLETPHDPRNSGYPEYPLLAIQVTPVPGQYFPTRRPTNVWGPWHVSICYKSDPYTTHDLAYLINKFDNKVVRLVLEPAETYEGTRLDLDRNRDPIASDPVVQKLHDNGYYRGRPFHISA